MQVLRDRWFSHAGGCRDSDCLPTQRPSHLSGRDKFISASVCPLVLTLIHEDGPNSTWFKKNRNSLVHLPWLCWERLALGALWPKGLTGVERIQFLGSVFHSDGSAPGICHLTYGNFSRNKQCLFPCCANKVLIASHCFLLGYCTTTWCSAG